MVSTMLTVCRIWFLLLALLATADIVEKSVVTPVEKVIVLLEDLKGECEAEGVEEAKIYDAFACFCKDNTQSKSSSIISGRESIESLSATIEEKSAGKSEKILEIQTRRKKHESIAMSVSQAKTRLAAARVDFQREDADIAQAITSLENAISALEASKPSSLIELHNVLIRSLDLAKVLNVQSKHPQAVATFLQKIKSDPDDSVYNFHSQEIINMMQGLLKDFTAEKVDLTTEWEKTSTTENELIEDGTSMMEENGNIISQLEGHVDSLGTAIAQARESLVEAESILKDDQLYLKDLTQRCEERATIFDQRSTTRSEEVKVLNEALTILNARVSNTMAAGEGSRALLQSTFQRSHTLSRSRVSFLQQRTQSVSNVNAQKLKIIKLLSEEGKRLGSISLMTLTTSISTDPFVKVKQLIQALIERLLAESAAEATKKGFCDVEVGKATLNRDHKWGSVRELNAELATLGSKQDALEFELGELANELEKLNEYLTAASKLRVESKEENLAILKDAKEGLAAVSEAILILKVFYKKAAKSKVFLDASPVDEDDPGSATQKYAGKQEASKAIFGLLEVIQSDFQRTIASTQRQEATDAAKFVEFNRVSQATIAGKETKVTLDTEDLRATTAAILTTMNNLQKMMNLVDSALQELHDLQAMCVDTGMSFADRVAKREEEIAALKKALCILDSDNVEPDCQ